MASSDTAIDAANDHADAELGRRLAAALKDRDEIESGQPKLPLEQ